MLSSLRGSVFQTTSFNGGNSASLSVVRFRYVFVQYIHSSSSSSSSSFVVDYLINSCGLSEHQAITASKTVDFKTSSKPDSVLDLLENSGFTKPHISKLITGYPKILKSKTLKPKFDFFKSQGLSGIDLAEFLSSNPGVLNMSLQKIIPCCGTLKNIVQFDKNVTTIIRRHSWLLTGNQYLRNLLVNIELLIDEGPQPNVSNFLINQPRALTISTSKFEEIVQQIKGMRFDPSQTTFLAGIQTLTAMTKSTWETKLDAYRKWGWTEDEIQNAFKKHPQCMKKIMSIMEYLVNQMGYNPSMLAKFPLIFNFSLEKRIIPRCVVIQFLVSHGQVKKHSLRNALTISEKSFLEKYVSKYGAEVPEILKVYHTSLLSTS